MVRNQAAKSQARISFEADAQVRPANPKKKRGQTTFLSLTNALMGDPFCAYAAPALNPLIAETP
jgi:hypothetical protein